MDNIHLIESLKLERDSHLKVVEALNQAIQALEVINPNGKKNLPATNEYDPDWQLAEKIEYFLKREKRFLYNRELATMANEIEPEISTEAFTSKFSAVLSRLKSEGKIKSVQIGKALKDTVWGSPKWLDENEKILKDYLPKKNEETKIKTFDI